jgi:endonuclease YncB( thermonuclease family)
MPGGTRLRGATGPVAPFLFPALLLCAATLLWIQVAVASGPCSYAHIDERSRVVYVYDGDTIKLQDGRRVRLIGINTPELGRDGKPNEALASKARDTLQQILDSGNRTVLLQYDSEQHDHYGRLLAHVFLESGDNVVVQLLQKGMAAALVVPPNTWGLQCYQQLENDARIDRVGLWQLDSYQPRDSTTLTADSRGFTIVRGRVTAVRQTKHSTRVDLQGLLTLHIDNRDRINFPEHMPESLNGKEVEVRGWIRQSGKRLQMTVQHPAAVIPLTTEAAP